MFELLLNLGADINGTGGEDRKTVLFHADENTLKYLVEKGIDVNKQDCYGRTALMYYAMGGNIEAVKYLVEHGADVNICCGGESFTKSELSGNALNIIAKDITERDLFDTKFGETLKCLVDAGIDLNQQDNYGDTVLHFACLHGRTKLVKYLIDKGADVNKQNNDGENALARVGGRTDPQIIKDLLEAGSNVNMQSKRNPSLVNIADYTYPDKAFSDKALESMKMLVEAGADINIQDQYGQTPLMRAVRRENKDFVKYLCDAGADLEIKDNSGKTAYDYANGKSEILGIMQNAKLEALQKAAALRAKQGR